MINEASENDEANFPGFPQQVDLEDPYNKDVLEKFSSLTDDDIDHQAHFEAEQFLEEHADELDLDYWKTQHYKVYEKRRRELTINRKRACELLGKEVAEEIELSKKAEKITSDKVIKAEEMEKEDFSLKLTYRYK